MKAQRGDLVQPRALPGNGEDRSEKSQGVVQEGRGDTPA